MTKKEIRAQLLEDTLAYVLRGNAIQEIPAAKVKIKHQVRGRTSNTFNQNAGLAPTFRISGLYNSGE
jgi:hypothetical protein